MTDFADIFLIDIVGTEFIFDLHHKYGAPFVYSEVAYLFGHLALEQRHAFHECRIVVAQLHVAVLEQPPGEAPHIPLGANIRSGTEYHLHLVFVTQLYEVAQVVIARKIELARFFLMCVPEYIQADCVHAQRLAKLYPVLPVVAGDSRIMQLGGFDNEGLAIEHERAFAGLESRRLRVCPGLRRAERECDEKSLHQGADSG